MLQNNDSFAIIVNDRTVTNKVDVDMPQNKNMDIPSKNNNQSSLPVKVPTKKVSKEFFNSDIVKDHISTNNKDVGIPQKKDVNIPQNKDNNISFENNNQSSVLVKVPLNKVSNPFFNIDIAKYHVSTNNKDVGIPQK